MHFFFFDGLLSQRMAKAKEFFEPLDDDDGDSGGGGGGGGSGGSDNSSAGIDIVDSRPASDDEAREPSTIGTPSGGERRALTERHGIVHETRELIVLSAALFTNRVAWVAIKMTDSALLGHSSTHALSAAAMADLWTSSTGVIVQGGVLGTFVGQAVGAGNHKLAGIWLQLSLVVLMCICVPVIGLWCLTGPTLRAFGVSNDLASDAWLQPLSLFDSI